MKKFNVNAILTLCVFLWCVSLFVSGQAEIVLLGVAGVGLVLSAVPLVRRKEYSVSSKLMYAMFTFVVIGKFFDRLGIIGVSTTMLVIAAIFFFIMAVRLVCFFISHDFRKDVEEVEFEDPVEKED